MGIRYKTIMNQAEAYIMIDKSKFFGYIMPVETAADAEEFIKGIKSAHRDATHNVPVYLLGESFDIQRYSDDGEPSGTAGVPVLQMFIKEGITNVAIVMTRYFGGIKLGTGGLVRAYTAIAKAALKEAVVAEVKDVDVLTVRFEYTYYGKIENLETKGEFSIKDAEFDEGVTIRIVSDPEKTESIKDSLMEITGGTCDFISHTQELEKIPVFF